MAEQAFDIAVVGAGAAGLCAALAFARDGFSTVLVGAIEAQRDGRTIALLNGSIRLLDALETWPAIMPRAAPLETMRLVDDTDNLFRPPPVAFRASEIGLDAFGWNVENAVLVEELAGAVRRAGTIAMAPERVTSCEPLSDCAEIGLVGGRSLRAALVVAADGRRSFLREEAKIPTKTWSYPQAALTAILAHERDHRETSTEFHHRHGPFTLVPLPDRRSKSRLGDRSP